MPVFHLLVPHSKLEHSRTLCDNCKKNMIFFNPIFQRARIFCNREQSVFKVLSLSCLGDMGKLVSLFIGSSFVYIGYLIRLLKYSMFYIGLCNRMPDKLIMV